jgi:hypothetical protein
MQSFGEAEFSGETLDGLEGADGVVLPGFARSEHVGPHRNSQLGRVRLNAGYILGADDRRGVP